MNSRTYGGHTLADVKKRHAAGLNPAIGVVSDLLAAAEELERLRRHESDFKAILVAEEDHRLTVEKVRDELQITCDQLRAENERLRQSLNKIATMAEHYNYVGWQRIVGQMQKEAIESLAFGALKARRALEGN